MRRAASALQADRALVDRTPRRCGFPPSASIACGRYAPAMQHDDLIIGLLTNLTRPCVGFTELKDAFGGKYEATD